MDDIDMTTEGMMRAARAVAAGIAAPGGWIGRRQETFGASDIPALLYRLGKETPEKTTPKYVIENMRRLLEVKAGAKRPMRSGRAAQMGIDAERRVVEQWNDRTPPGWPRVRYVPDHVPRAWLPLIDRYCPRLSATPDAWIVIDESDEAPVNVQVKTDRLGSRTEPDREWIWQVHAEMAVTGSVRTMILYAPGWIGEGEAKSDLVPWVVDRDEQLIDRIRSAVIDGWKIVDDIKSRMEK